MLKKLTGVFVILLCSFILLTCDGNYFPIDPIKNLGQIMVTHASPDLAHVDVYLDDNLFSKDQSYPNTTPYTALKEGQHTVSLKMAGTDDVTLAAEIDLKAGDYYSLFACDAAAQLTALVVKDEYPKPDTDETLIRFVHLSPDAPAVDITIGDGRILFSSVEFKGSTVFKTLPSGTYDLQIRLAGTARVVAELKDVKLHKNLAHTFWARGFVNGSQGQELGGQLIFNRVVI